MIIGEKNTDLTGVDLRKRQFEVNWPHL